MLKHRERKWRLLWKEEWTLQQHRGFEKEIFQKLDGVTELVLDFTDLAYLSSAGLRVLLSCQKKMNAAKGSMVVKHVNEIIMEVFEATGFDSILTVEQ